MNLMTWGAFCAGVGLICLAAIFKSYLRRRDISKVDKIVFWISIFMFIFGIFTLGIGLIVGI